MTDTVSVTTTTTIVTTTTIPEDVNCLVRVRAQVMSRDDSSGGWVPLLGGGLSNVSVRRRTIAAALIPSTSAITTTTTTVTNNTTANGSVDSSISTIMKERHDYVIDGHRISDQSIVLSCTMKKDFEYNKVMPTFHHWKTGDKRFGLTFQTAADARAFDKGVRTAFEDLLDGLTKSNRLCTNKKGGKREKGDPCRDDDVFMTLDLPQDLTSRISSSNSSSKTSVQLMRPPTEASALFYDPVGKNDNDDKGGNYAYVQLQVMHDYVYPSSTAVAGTSLVSPHLGSKKPIDSTTTTSSSGGSTTTVIQQQPTPESGKASPEISHVYPSSEGFTGGQLARQHHLCRYCHERFMPGSKNKTGSCEYAPDPCRVCINSVSCIRAAECVSYHCASDAEGELPQTPCACTCPGSGNGEIGDERCVRRWLCVTLLSLFVPCLWLYPILNACHWCSIQCGLCGGRHAAMPLPIPPAAHN